MTRHEAAWAVEQHIEALREKLEDAEGESSACVDSECACHEAPARLRDLIAEFEDAPRPCPDCGSTATVEFGDERQTIAVCAGCGIDQ